MPRTCYQQYGEKALSACLKATLAEPDNQKLHRRLAFVHMEMEAYEEAVKALKAMARKWPRSWQPGYDLASLLTGLYNYKAAVAPIEASLRLAPDKVDSLMLARIVYVGIKQKRKAFLVTLRAARLGDRVAMFQTAYHFETGAGTQADQKQAGKWMKQAAEAGHVGAMDRMTEAYLNGGIGYQVDSRQAEIWATRARKARGR